MIVVADVLLQLLMLYLLLFLLLLLLLLLCCYLLLLGERGGCGIPAVSCFATWPCLHRCKHPKPASSPLKTPF